MTEMAQERRLPGIDGLRTAAVLAVFLGHVRESLFPGGNIGVDVFFVISGFVITSLLLRDVATNGRIRLGRFYVNRLWRLAPALLTMVVVVTAYLLIAGRLADAARSVPALTYTMNIFRMVPDAGFGSVFGHTWSLAIEEQFYLVWPLALIFALRRGRPAGRTVTVTALVGVAIAVVSTVLVTLAFGNGPEVQAVIYNSPVSRGSQLLLGCALAGWVASRQRTPSRGLINAASAVALFGLFLWVLVVSLGRYTEDAAWTFPVLAVLGGLVVLGAIDRGTFVGRILGARHVAEAGRRYSYAFYLWHYPVIGLLVDIVPGPMAARAVAVFVVSAAAAAFTHHLIEEPVRAHRGRRLSDQRRDHRDVAGRNGG